MAARVQRPSPGRRGGFSPRQAAPGAAGQGAVIFGVRVFDVAHFAIKPGFWIGPGRRLPRLLPTRPAGFFRRDGATTGALT